MHNLTFTLMLVIRIYDVVGLPSGELHEAKVIAAGTMEGSGIHTAWLVCPKARQRGAVYPSTCGTLPQEGELLIRILHDPHPEATAETLGYASVDTKRSTGALATVFADRISRLAADAGINQGTLLGWAMTHEIGHLLLGSTTHPPRGLMRARWSAEEVRRQMPRDWTFSADESSRMRERVGS